mmetsp:Transcript_33503/g.52134  ORF Transcript_33503/g.52134 Transcript_33503/m.52134 type:complete len:117 (+) Transcript_33503:2561-2911(+)
MAQYYYSLSTLGIQLGETLEELLNECVIDFDLVETVRNEFDRAMMTVLRKEVREKPVIRGKLNHYQHCDGIWAFYIAAPEIRANNFSLPIHTDNSLKIIGCDSKIFSEKVKKKKKK